MQGSEGGTTFDFREDLGAGTSAFFLFATVVRAILVPYWRMDDGLPWGEDLKAKHAHHPHHPHQPHHRPPAPRQQPAAVHVVA